MKYRLFVAIALATVGCAAQKATTPSPIPQAVLAPALKNQNVSNISYFDLAVCRAPRTELPSPANKELLTGALVESRPLVMECLVNPENRGSSDETTVSIDLTVTTEKIEPVVAGTNLTPAGKACIESIVKKLSIAPLPKGGTPITGHAEFRHGPENPSVTFGADDASNIAGKIRLGTAEWCDCYADWSDKPAKTVQMKLKFLQGQPPAIIPETTTDATTDKVASCLKSKLESLNPAFKSDEITFTYPFFFVNSALASGNAEFAPEIRFVQLDGVRNQLAANSAIAFGSRLNAVATYDQLVRKYKAKPSFSLVNELKDKCATLLKRDDDWIAALQQQLETGNETIAYATELKSKDTYWNDAEARAQKAAVEIKGNLAIAEKTRTSDEAVCPKEKKK